MPLEQQDLSRMLETAIVSARLAGQRAMEEINFIKTSITTFSLQLRNRIIFWWIQHINNTDYRTFVIYKGHTRWKHRLDDVEALNEN